MKTPLKVLCIALTACILAAVPAGAQTGLGIKAGIYTNQLSDLEHYDMHSNLGFQAGVLYKINLPMGFAIQPELLYVERNTKLENNAGTTATSKDKYNLKYLQVPVSIQWGPNLMLVRPYVQVVPYMNFLMGKKFTNGADFGDLHKANTGIGVGAGLDVWKLQISGRYNWDFNKMGNTAGTTYSSYKELKQSKGRGLEFSIAFIF